MGVQPVTTKLTSQSSVAKHHNHHTLAISIDVRTSSIKSGFGDFITSAKTSRLAESQDPGEKASVGVEGQKQQRRFFLDHTRDSISDDVRRRV